MKFGTFIRKFIIWSAAGLAIIFALSVILVFSFQNRLVQYATEQINKQLTTTLTMDDEVNVSFEKLPHLALKFSNIEIKESINPRLHLARAKTAFISVNPFDLILGEYTINRIFLEDASIKLRVLEDGSENYTIFKEDTASGGDISFDLKSIGLRNVLVIYSNEKIGQVYDIHSKDSEANLGYTQNTYNIALDGQLVINDILIGDNSYFRDKTVQLSSKNKLLVKEKKYQVLPSELQVEGSTFLISGNYDYGEQQNNINFNFEARKANIQTLVSLLPENMHNSLDEYDSKGSIYFKGEVRGPVTDTENPLIDFDFGFKNASFFHPELKGKITGANLKGSFTNGKERSGKTSSLTLRDISCDFDGNPVSGNFSLRNFNDPYVDLQAYGGINTRSLLKFYPSESVEKAAGSIHFDIDFKGRPESLMETNKGIVSSGQIELKNLALKLKELPYSFSSINGKLRFNKDDVIVNELRGFAGKSDFLLKGTFRNFISSLAYDKKPMVIDATFRSAFIDGDELIFKSGNDEKTTGKDSTIINLTRKYRLKLDCDIKKVKKNNFVASGMKGRLTTDSRQAVLENWTIGLAGGATAFNSRVNLRNPENLEILVDAKFDSLMVDSLFHSFQEFGQEFLTSKNLKGKMSGVADLYIPLNNNLDVIWDKVYGKVNLLARNGELNDFTPMFRLSNLVNISDLMNVRFSELHNTFTIKDNKIEVPEMLIRSNVSDIKIAGSQSFDNRMEYYLTIPLRNFSEKQKKDARGAFTNDGRGNTVVFLKITGTSDDYKVQYDTKRAAAEAVRDIGREKDELMDILSGNKKEDPVEVSDDDFFEPGW